MSKKIHDPTIKFTPPDDRDATLGDSLPAVRPSRGLEHAESVPSEVACFKTPDQKVVCGVVLTPPEDHRRNLAAATPSTARSASTTVCIEGEDRGTRVCRDVVIDTVEVRTTAAAALSDTKTPSDE